MGTAPRPILFRWNGDNLVPHPAYKVRAEREFTVGIEYPMVVFETRTQATHNHYFASVVEGWKNLPEGIAKRFPSSEHLRKWALVQAGYCDETNIIFDTAEDAKKFAIQLRKHDEYCVITVRENVVFVATAKTQSVAAMSKEIFQQSKTAVLDIIAGLIGTTTKELSDNAGQSA